MQRDAAKSTAAGNGVSEMPERERPTSERFRVMAKAWVEADAAASLLEETKSSCLSQRMLELGNMPVSRAEMIVKASKSWHDHIRTIVDARSKANLIKVELDYLKMVDREVERAEWAQRSERRMMR